jgi:proliferating cell nuclear antigen
MKRSSTNIDTVMELRTVQATVLKSLFDGIKEILMDINIVFTPTSINSTAIDGSKSACVNFSLDTEKFEHYVCTEDSFIIGVNMVSLHKLIKPISNGDVIFMRISKSDRFKLQIVIENSEKRTRLTSYLKLLDIDHQFFEIPNVEFDNIITMGCVDFQRHCKDMISVSDKVHFSCSNNYLIMKCYGDFADFIVEINKNDDENAEDIGVFSLKFINLFIKSSNLCTNVEIFLKKSYPLILVYKIGSLGKLQFVLAPNCENES